MDVDPDEIDITSVQPQFEPRSANLKRHKCSVMFLYYKLSPSSGGCGPNQPLQGAIFGSSIYERWEDVECYLLA